MLIRHATHLWTDLHTGRIQRRCLCDQWVSLEMTDTPENRRILVKRAREHVEENADGQQSD